MMGKHTEWRKLVKNARRKRIRQKLAQERCALEKEEQQQRENSPSYRLWVENQRLLEDQQRIEEDRAVKEAHRRWIEVEQRAQEEWQILQDKLTLVREESARQQTLIKAEWEKEQRKLKELEEKKLKEEEEKLKQQLLLQEQLENFIEKGGHIPKELQKILETNPNKPVCPFYKKVGACRFGDACSRNHQRPYQSMENEYGSNSLEFESHERYSHFKEFFYDVLPELEKFGDIKQFEVCCNEEPHLRGNVYVEYSSSRAAMKAYRMLQGRWYGGKQLNVEFCGLESWKNAICGLFFKKACPKGSACNFLHVFRNPGNLYHYIDRENHSTKTSLEAENDSTGRNWRWSESPERIIHSYREDEQTRSKDKSSENGRERSRKHIKLHSKSLCRDRSRSAHSQFHKKIYKKSKR
ncbi:RNA recognition motif [Popillia japonica]|uniref:RNA recognition motif n=1 Tax=Popillia japonica TaxID=7064 RepID=A0AAW1IX31_POPJA